ncbi:MAG: Veg family protein [Clostridia bacterium]|nr:Veg family protein [Clostridia bacterium]
MRRAVASIECARDQVEGLLGKNVLVRYNRGRNRVSNYKGRVEQCYSHVFMLHLNDSTPSQLTCSYIDILCGEISLKEAKS